MFLLPLWPKDALRFPTFTVALLAANVVVFSIAWPLQLHQASRVGQDDIQRSASQLTAILLASDSGIADAARDELKRESDAQPFPSRRLLDILKETQAGASTLTPASRYSWDINYPVFESYVRSAENKPLGTTVFKRWGFDPERDWWPGLITHEFLHDGWLHLLFNLLFLWIAGSIAEARLGAHVVWLYLSAGVAGALAQAQYGIPSGQILVGASGAIGGLMGFCLISEPKAKVKLFYLAFFSLIPKYGVFDSPLWFYLPVWLLSQVLLALVHVNSSQAAVANAAHIGGFVFGALVGLVWRTSQTDPA